MCLEQGIISKEEVVCPVDASGRFTSEVTDFVGQYVKVSLNGQMAQAVQNEDSIPQL